MKKILSLVLALAMIMMVGAVYADGATNNLTADTTISVTNLDQGDIVALYKIIEWNANGYWAPAASYNGLSQEDVDKIVGQNHETGAKITEGAGWTDAYINKVITNTLPTPIDLGTSATVGTDKAFTYTAAPGMYYVLVTPKDGTKIYKPMFVSADYSATNTTTTVAAKFETITINKKATSQTDDQDSSSTNHLNTVGIGDTVGFEIDTTIPLFPQSFTTPIFNVSDTLNGLTLKHGAGEIKVYAGTVAAENLLDGSQYTLTATDAGFTVEFKSTYIKGLTASQPIKVVYEGVVNNAAEYNVNAKENTAKVNFSNNPDDSVGANELKDETRHYTFSINGKVSYTGDEHGTDLIKVGINADGSEITQTVQLPNKHYAGSLEGAVFTLYQSDKTTVYKGLNNLTSGANGAIEINGLDAGTYYLRETSAPAGYIKSNQDAKIEVIPTFTTKTVPAETKTVTVGNKQVTVTVPEYSYDELVSYTIKINDVVTSTYTVTNDKITGIDDDQIGAGSSEGNPGTDATGKIKNPKGTELPSTGGIGTTIFYIVGGILLVGAAVILVARRKAQE
jgi:LPXTG-motif cell wall-anchored protein